MTIKIGRFGVIGGICALATALAIVVAMAFGVGAPKPTNAETINGTTGLLLFNGLGYTTTQTGTLQDTRYFGTCDLYFAYDSTSAAGAATTPTLFHSADGVNWVTNTLQVAGTNTAAAGASFTRTTLYGHFVRVIMAVANTNAVTASVRCAMKNSQQ